MDRPDEGEAPGIGDLQTGLHDDAPGRPGVAHEGKSDALDDMSTESGYPDLQVRSGHDTASEGASRRAMGCHHDRWPPKLPEIPILPGQNEPHLHICRHGAHTSCFRYCDSLVAICNEFFLLEELIRRLEGVVWFSVLSGYTDIFLHDVSRPLERQFGDEFLCGSNLVKSVGDLWHFRVHPSNTTPFCNEPLVTN